MCIDYDITLEAEYAGRSENGMEVNKSILDQVELRALAADLIRIDEAGRLDELHSEIFADINDRSTDLAHCTGSQRLYVEKIAGMLHRVLDVPHEACLAAVADLVLPTRRNTVQETIKSYVRELDGTTEAETTPDGTPKAIERARIRKANGK